MATNFYESLDSKKSPQVKPCWLDTNIAALDDSHKPVEIFQQNMSNAGTILAPVCPDSFRRSSSPGVRTRSGLTISIPYFAQPALLLQQLSNFADYPESIQKKLSIIIIDDGSPLGLRATDYLNTTASNNTSLYYLNKKSSSSLPIRFYFMLRIVHINNDIDWNVEGSHNLAFYLAKTRLGLILDLSMKIPIETIRDALTWNTTKINNETNQKQSVAHKFTRIRSNGKFDYHQTCALIDLQEYWNSGGMDEDFAGSFGYGTYPHFWHVWEKGGRYTEKHNTTYLIEQNTETCDSTWIDSLEKMEQCKTARSMMNSPTKEGRKKNRRLWRKKSEDKVKWSNTYLRFNWTIEF